MLKNVLNKEGKEEQRKKTAEGIRKSQENSVQYKQDIQKDYPTLLNDYFLEDENPVRKNRYLSLLMEQNPDYAKDISSPEAMLNALYKGTLSQAGTVKALDQRFQPSSWDARNKLINESETLKVYRGIYDRNMAKKKGWEKELDALRSKYESNPTEEGYWNYVNTYGEYEAWMNSGELQKSYDNYDRYSEKCNALSEEVNRDISQYQGASKDYQSWENAYVNALLSYEGNQKELYPEVQMDLEKLYLAGSEAHKEELGQKGSELASNQEKLTKVSNMLNDPKYLDPNNWDPAATGYATRQDAVVAYDELRSLVDRQTTELVNFENENHARMEAVEWERKAVEDPEFEKLSQYQSTAKVGEKSRIKPAYAPDDMPVLESGFGDIDYDVVNKNPVAVELDDKYSASTFQYLFGEDKKYVQNMTPTQVKIYNYYYKKEGKEKANEYLEVIKTGLTEKQREKEMARAAESVHEDFWGASGKSVLLSPGKFVTAIRQGVDWLEDGRIDENAAYNRPSYESNAIRQEASKIVEEEQGPAQSFAYNVGMSMADFLITSAVGNKTLSLAIMGSGAAADTTIAAKDRGLSDNQALALGIIAGGAEIITEKVSLDKLLDMVDLGENAVWYFVKNTLAEGSEEAASDVINMIADVLVSRDKSEWNLAMKSYMEEDKSLSQQDAFMKVLGDQLKQIGLDSLAGGASGGFMSGGAIVINGVTHVLTGMQSKATLDGNGKLQVTPVNAELGEKIIAPENMDEPHQILVGQMGLSEEDFQALVESQPAPMFQPAPKYSIVKTPNGEQLTVVDTRQDIFNGKPQKEYAKIARREILNHFKGQILPLGENDLARITDKTAREYAYPRKTLPNREYKAKMKVSTELDNLLKTAEYSHPAEDKKNHSEATLGFDYYKAKFVVDGRIFECLLNIATSERGRMLYDITKIQEISDSNGSAVRMTADFSHASFGDFQKNNISQTDPNNKYTQKNNLNSSKKVNYPAPFGVDPVEWERRVRKAKKAKTLLGITAALYNVDERTYAAAESLARETGARIVFDGALGPNQEGYHQNGVIHLNPRVEGNFAVVFAHELTHYLEGTSAYRELFSYVLSRYGDENAQQKAIAKKITEYSIFSEEQLELTVQEARTELVAEFIAKNLFSNKTEVLRLANFDLNLAEKIKAFLSRLAAKVTGNKERQFLLNAERLYTQAIEQARKGQNTRLQAREGNSTIENAKYSIKKYWKPKLTQAEWNLLNREMDTAGVQLNENTYWVAAAEKGVSIFAFYGIGDGTENTVLYASGGKKARTEAQKMNDYLEGRRNGINTRRGAFDRILEDVENQRRISGGDLLHRTGARAGDEPISLRQPGGNGRRGSGQSAGDSGTKFSLGRTESNPSSAEQIEMQVDLADEAPVFLEAFCDPETGEFEGTYPIKPVSQLIDEIPEEEIDFSLNYQKILSMSDPLEQTAALYGVKSWEKNLAKQIREEYGYPVIYDAKMRGSMATIDPDGVIHLNPRISGAEALEWEVREAVKTFEGSKPSAYTKNVASLSEPIKSQEWKEKYVDNPRKSAKIALTEDEHWALNAYISSDSYKLNEKLRCGKKPSKADERFMRALDSALDKMPERKGTVYRSITTDGIDDINAFLAGYEVGSPTASPAYTSAFVDIYDKDMPIQYVITSKHGKDISQFNDREQEILFKRGTYFVPTKIEGNTIYLEET